VKRARRNSSSEGTLPVEIDPKPLAETLTALGGLPLLVQTFRSLGVGSSVRGEVRVKERERGCDEAEMVESFVVLNAVGGECFEDFARLREDGGVKAILGYEVPSPETARQFLNQFHDEERIREAKRRRRGDEIAYIPAESEPLKGLGAVNRHLVGEVGKRCPEQRVATVDQDATIIESRKREALRTYEGERGYQPMLAVWAETNLILADEFRDGNVPAGMNPLSLARQAFAALPPTVTTYYYRGDSACHESDLINWLRDPRRAGGPEGEIGFAVSARMSEGLSQAIGQVEKDAWEEYGKNHPLQIRECAELNYVPSEKYEAKHLWPLRYVAIRIRSRQADLFENEQSVRHFAVVSNIWNWKPSRLIEWHREKAGTIEAVHDVLKNELAAGVMPSKYFGTNAAWLRLAVMAHNLLTALQRLALPAELLNARPKRLRFLIFNTPGRVVHHAHRAVLRLATTGERLAQWLEALKSLRMAV
jgi:hypothetical protein